VKVLGGHRRRQAEERLALGQAYEDHGLVFCREDGRPLDPDGVSQGFGRLVRRAGQPAIRFHDLRHTFATLSLKAGIPTEVVSRILGHKNPGITQFFYQHAIPGPGGAGDRAVRLVGRPGRERLESCRYQTGIRAAQTKEVPIARHLSHLRFRSLRGQDLNLRPLGYEVPG